MINDEADQVIDKPFKSFFKKYQIGLKESLKGSEFALNYFQLLHYKCHKINPNRRWSYKYSPD